MIKIIYESYRKIKTGVSLFWTTRVQPTVLDSKRYADCRAVLSYPREPSRPRLAKMDLMGNNSRSGISANKQTNEQSGVKMKPNISIHIFMSSMVYKDAQWISKLVKLKACKKEANGWDIRSFCFKSSEVRWNRKGCKEEEDILFCLTNKDNKRALKPEQC